ncbi:antitermination protein [Providencia manganoxydans]|uniref:antitermination protein Q n=1 Tax=Providencia manganoxydans TaxID=2923283 RepID=UPI0034E52A12
MSTNRESRFKLVGVNSTFDGYYVRNQTPDASIGDFVDETTDNTDEVIDAGGVYWVTADAMLDRVLVNCNMEMTLAELYKVGALIGVKEAQELNGQFKFEYNPRAYNPISMQRIDLQNECVVKHPCITTLEGETIIVPKIREELVGELCKDCNGKGQITHRCRCKGRGKVLDEEKTKLQGVPVFKDCPRCAGIGFSRVPSSVAYNAIRNLVPDLNERTWRRNWKPFYEKLTSKCFIEESIAEQVFSCITR